MATSKSSGRQKKVALDTIKIVSIVVIIALVVLIVLTLTDVIKLCPSRAGAKAKSKSKAKAKAKSKQQVDEADTDVPSGQGTSMLDMPMEKALDNFGKMKKAIMILGQNSCPACRMTKEYYSKNRMGDRVMFVDLAEMRDKPEVAKNAHVSKCLKMIGNGVPFIVLMDVETGEVLDKMTGFDPEKAGGMYEKAAGKDKLKTL